MLFWKYKLWIEMAKKLKWPNDGACNTLSMFEAELGSSGTEVG